jgi:hypothetical protein
MSLWLLNVELVGIEYIKLETKLYMNITVVST